MHTDKHANHRDRKRESLRQKREHGPGPLAASQRKVGPARFSKRTVDSIIKRYRGALDKMAERDGGTT
jgi:hypothetical protein